ncbi:MULTISPECIES: acyltransferase family protein [Pseudomonas aeruginosa group]|uniref:acyltransferase family protein n=1 Tax=Pseudomonas aeruginosa group TaxID=136841 RepID=UPI0005BA5E5F|nr:MULTISPECIES: acyltransferase family protein [Pseudomonas aeruginosa group]MDK2351642.1 acyltransferase family protein [Pseudomonas paraeruginosa]MEA8484398.1 acyltransferase family protein [Pseudomonas aeruginosa]
MPNGYPHPKYRRDIDGLRAVAVLSVVAFHAFPEWFGGGFIGVDVFFVISGFLISSIIFEGLEKGSFRFADFYIRRVRRIFPALLLVLAASGAVGWVILLPDEYGQLGKHIAAGAGFVSNLVLWSEAGYFDGAAGLKPLLHLWSLGVEEQFYIVWPLLAWIAWRFRLGFLWLVVLLAGASFGLSLYRLESDPVAAFYSPLARFWELLAGAGLAVLSVRYRHGLRRRPEFTAAASLLSTGGLLLLAGGFAAIDKSSAFPGAWALLPVSGAVLLIAAGEGAWFNRIVLSHPLLVWIGLISYPLYLWHWPLLVFARITEGGVPAPELRAALAVVSVALAWATYRLVEKPIRRGEPIFAYAVVPLAVMAVCGVFGYKIHMSGGVAERFPKLIQGLTQYRFPYAESYREGSCFLRPEQGAEAFRECPPDAVGRRGRLLLWGDSHAAHLYPGYKAIYGGEFGIVQRTASGCPPMPGIDVESRVHCRAINDEVMSFVAASRPDKVVLAAIWTSYDLSRLEDTVGRLRAAGVGEIDLVGPVPQWRDGLPKQLYLRFRDSMSHRVPVRMSSGLDERFMGVDDILREKAVALGVNYISPRRILCDDEGCLTRLGDTGDQLTAWDYGHLTDAASVFLVGRFAAY